MTYVQHEERQHQIDLTEVRSLSGGDLVLNNSTDIEVINHGEVFTRRWVVDLILDLVGYKPERDLGAMTAVEPACGAGAFLEAMVERLVASCKLFDRNVTDCPRAIQGFDLLTTNVEASRNAVRRVLVQHGLEDAAGMADAWVEQRDFLLSPPERESADFVIGNPPYIRLEELSDETNMLYREACNTMGGRADIYVGFFEMGLRSLAPGAVLGFICADRWMRNQYGKHLREMVSDSYSVETILTMHDVDAFVSTVSAYPAITTIKRSRQSSVLVGDTTAKFGNAEAPEVIKAAQDATFTVGHSPGLSLARLPHWFSGGASWPSGSPDQLRIVEMLEEKFAPLQDPSTGTKVGIGVATGADKVFITKDATLVEADRLLPLAMVRDGSGGTLKWSGHYLVNPWTADGNVVNLDDFPKLRAYYESRATELKRRNVAQRALWYRTIDKVAPGLLQRQKLYFPDFKTSIHPVLDDGQTYPHHNLYFVTSTDWDMRVLGGLLLSDIANLFVKTYAVKMRGGTLRFQAQYLRRIRVPDPSAISRSDAKALAAAFDNRDVQSATAIALRLYGLDEVPV